MTESQSQNEMTPRSVVKTTKSDQSREKSLLFLLLMVLRKMQYENPGLKQSYKQVIDSLAITKDDENWILTFNLESISKTTVYPLSKFKFYEKAKTNEVISNQGVSTNEASARELINLIIPIDAAQAKEYTKNQEKFRNPSWPFINNKMQIVLISILMLTLLFSALTTSFFSFLVVIPIVLLAKTNKNFHLTLLASASYVSAIFIVDFQKHDSNFKPDLNLLLILNFYCVTFGVEKLRHKQRLTLIEVSSMLAAVAFLDLLLAPPLRIYTTFLILLIMSSALQYLSSKILSSRDSVKKLIFEVTSMTLLFVLTSTTFLELRISALIMLIGIIVFFIYLYSTSVFDNSSVILRINTSGCAFLLTVTALQNTNEKFSGYLTLFFTIGCSILLFKFPPRRRSLHD